MSQKWSTMKQLRDDLPNGCTAEKTGHGSVQINIYDPEGECIIHAGTGHNTLKPVLKHAENLASSVGIDLKSNRR